MNINFDKKIESELKKEVKIPQSVLTKVNEAFDEIRVEENEKINRVYKFNKKLITSLIAISVFSLIAINPKVLANISSFFKDKGVQKAANNGYIQTLDNEVKNNGVSIKTDDIVADKNKIAVSFTLKFDDINKLKDVNDIQLGLNIKDNNDRVIFEHLQEGIHSPLRIGSEWNTDISNKDNGEIKYYLIMYSREGELSDIDKLFLRIDSISLYNESVKGRTKTSEISGDWDFKLTLDENLKDKEEIKYIAENNNEIVKVDSVEVLPTGMLIKFNINATVDENIVNQVIITDENGNEYYKFSGASMEDIPGGGAKLSMMFDVTTFDNLDKLKMIVKDIQGKDITLNLIKEDK